MDDQLGADLFRKTVAKLDHLAKFVSGIDMQQRERQLAGEEGLLGQTHHHRGVFSDRVKHHRLGKLGHHFAKNVDAFGFQCAKVRKRHLFHGISFILAGIAVLAFSGRWAGDSPVQTPRANRLRHPCPCPDSNSWP